MKGDCPQQKFYRVPAIKFNPKRYGQTNTLYINLSSLLGDPKYTEFNVKSSGCNQALVSLEAVHNSKRLTSIDQWNMVFVAVYTFIRQLALIGSLSKGVFKRRTSTGSEVFSLLTCLDDIKFVFLSFFTVIEAI